MLPSAIPSAAGGSTLAQPPRQPHMFMSLLSFSPQNQNPEAHVPLIFCTPDGVTDPWGPVGWPIAQGHVAERILYLVDPSGPCPVELGASRKSRIDRSGSGATACRPGRDNTASKPSLRQRVNSTTRRRASPGQPLSGSKKPTSSWQGGFKKTKWESVRKPFAIVY